MLHELFTYKGFTLSYRIYGDGPEDMLAFHGFGIDSEMWKDFAVALSPRFRMICVDAVHHGFSSMPEDRSYTEPLRYSELEELHLALLDSLEIEKVWLAGYSMGGRIALGLIHSGASRYKGLILLAPDGLVRRPWYRGLAHNSIGHRLYDHWVENPALFNTITRLAFRTRIIDERMYTFLMDHSATFDKRALVRSIWFTLRKIEPDLGQVAANIKTAGYHVWLFLGKHDSIVTPTQGKSMKSLLGERCSVHLLETGHTMVFNRTGKLVLDILEKEKGQKPLH
jgi:pimeloyl-ACP methyl ester carboxylesterase